MESRKTRAERPNAGVTLPPKGGFRATRAPWPGRGQYRVRSHPSGNPPALLLQRLPAGELCEQQSFDLLQALAVDAQLLRVLAVVLRSTHAGGEIRLLTLEGLDFLGQGVQLALFLKAEFAARPGNRWCRVFLFGGGGLYRSGGRRFALSQPVRISPDILPPRSV